jgi:hypothetical protein
MKKSLLLSLVGLTLLSTTAVARDRIVDGIPDDQVIESVGMTGRPGYATTAALLAEEGDADLTLVIIEAQGAANYLVVRNNQLGLSIENPVGTNPRLAINGSGSLLLSQDNENFSAARGQWRRTLTMTYRDGEYVLSGFTLNYYDRLNGKTDVCDYNLLSGRGILNGRQVRILTQPANISNLTDSDKLYTCKGW